MNKEQQQIADRILSEFNKHFGKQEWHEIAAIKIWNTFENKKVEFKPVILEESNLMTEKQWEILENRLNKEPQFPTPFSGKFEKPNKKMDLLYGIIFGIFLVVIGILLASLII